MTATTKRSLILTPLVLALAAGTAYPQDNAPQRYATAIYFKTAPGQESAYIDFYKTGLGAKSIRAMQKANPDIISWTLRQVMYPGEQATGANFVLVTTFSGPPKTPDAAKRDAIYREAVGLTYSEYTKKLATMGERMGNSIVHIHDMTAGFQIDEGDILLSRRFRTAAGRSNEHSQMIKNMRMPLVSERVKLGQFKGYTFGHIALGGAASAWDASETWLYKDLAGALRMNSTPSMKELFAKVHPGKNPEEFRKTMGDLATFVREDVYRVAVVIRPEGNAVRSSRED